MVETVLTYFASQHFFSVIHDRKRGKVLHINLKFQTKMLEFVIKTLAFIRNRKLLNNPTLHRHDNTESEFHCACLRLVTEKFKKVDRSSTLLNNLTLTVAQGLRNSDNVYLKVYTISQFPLTSSSSVEGVLSTSPRWLGTTVIVQLVKRVRFERFKGTMAVKTKGRAQKNSPTKLVIVLRQWWGLARIFIPWQLLLSTFQNVQRPFTALTLETS